MQQYTTLAGVELTRFSAIKPESHAAAANHLSLRARADLLKGRRTHEGMASIGAVGCYLSHYAVWREFLDSGKQVLIVLEDDLDDKLQLSPYIEHFLKTDKAWDIGLLGWIKLFGFKLPLDAHGYVVPFPASSGFWGSHAYMMTRRTAEIMVKRAFPIEMQLDFFLQTIAWDEKLKILQPPETFARITQSNVLGSDVANFCLTCEPLWIYIAACAFTAIILMLISYILFFT